MRITFLGTGAAGGYPNAFCRCANCEQARVLGGPSLGNRSAALIDDALLIDLGPDVMAASLIHGRSLVGVRYCLRTHSHADHLDASHLLAQPRVRPAGGAPAAFLHLARYGRRRRPTAGGGPAPSRLLNPAVGARLNLTIHPVAALQAFTAGPYPVTRFAANHDLAVEPLLYAIVADGRTIFYGADTAPLPEATWRGFHEQRLRFDVMILDHTCTGGGESADKLTATRFPAPMARLGAEGLPAPGARCFAQHIAHDMNPVHPALAALAAAHSYEVA